MKKLTILLVYILIMHVLPAQNNFMPAIIIGLNNDTLKGLVDFRTDQLNASECRFRTTEDAPDRLFNPRQIAGYKFTKAGKYYISHDIAIDSLRSERVFLEFLVQGYVNLYYYQDKEKLDHYYFEKTKGQLIEATKKRDHITNLRFKAENTWYSSSPNYNKNLNDEDYRVVLSYLFQESSKIIRRVESTDFERKNLIELTSQYNIEVGNKTTNNIVFANDNLKTFFNAVVSVMGGVQYLNYASVPKYLIQNYSIESQSVMPVVTGQFSITSPRVTKSFALIVDLSLSKFTGTCDYVGKYSTYYNYQFDALRAGTSVGLKYMYLKNKTFHPFVEGALANSVFFFKSSTLNIYDRYFNHEVKTNYLLPENIIGGYRLALGSNYMLKNNHSLMAKINYEKQSDYKDQITVWELKLGYSF